MQKDELEIGVVGSMAGRRRCKSSGKGGEEDGAQP